MDDNTFWKLIDRARKQSEGDPDEMIENLCEALAKLPAEDILDFDRMYDVCRFRAYTRNLWGAAYLLNGGCSDDGFEYFRAWLIAQGKKVFEDALKDPDSLAKFADPCRDDFELEDMLYVADNAYERKTSKPLPTRTRQFPELTGEEWDEDELDQLYPRIAAKLARSS